MTSVDEYRNLKAFKDPGKKLHPSTTIHAIQVVNKFGNHVDGTEGDTIESAMDIYMDSLH